MKGKLEITKGDITRLKVDAIVNAANERLAPGGGVCGAIHAAAGPELAEECRLLGKCPTGEARITRGYNLKARWVVHAVGPVWQGGLQGERELLARAYRNALAVASKPEYGIRSIAFPALSAGIYGYPIEDVALVAVDECDRCLTRGGPIREIKLVCFSDASCRAFEAARSSLLD